MESVTIKARPVEEAGISRSFWMILGGQWISQIGDQIQIVALPMFILTLTGSALSLGLVMAAVLFPLTLLSPFAGVLADRWNRKRLLVVSDALSGLIVLVLAYLAWSGQMTMEALFLASAALSAMSALFLPALMASIPNLVGQNQLTRANALMEFGRSSSTIVGPAIGGILIASLGFPLAFLLNGLSFCFSALVVNLSSVPQTQAARSASQASILGDLKKAVTYLMGHRVLLYFVGIIALLNFFEPAILPIVMPVVADNILGVGDVGYGVMRTAYGLGGLISLVSLALVMEQRKKHRLMVVCIGGMGIVFLALGLGITLYPVVLVTLFLYGVMASVTNILVLVVIQTLIPDSERGKVFGLLATIAAALIPVSFLVVGLVLDRVSPVWFLVTSAVMLVAGAVSLYWVRGMHEL